MAEYIEREATRKLFCEKCKGYYDGHCIHRGECDVDVIQTAPAADVQEKKYCRMIPLEPDCRDYTDMFICTNCHQYIHLGFIRQKYSGNYCLECGAEVKDGEENDN